MSSILEPATVMALLGWAALDRKADPPSRQVPLQVDPDNPYSLPSGNPIARMLGRIFRAQRTEIRAWLRRQILGSVPLSAPSLSHWEARTVRDLTTRLASYRTEAAKATAKALGLDPKGIPDQRAAAQEQAARIAAEIHETTRGRLQAALDRLRAEGRTAAPAEVRSVVEDVFTNALDERAGLIARTETSDAVHSASLEVAVSIPGQMKIWLLDGNPCGICIDNSGAGAIPVADLFPGGVGNPPQHPRCSCSIELN